VFQNNRATFDGGLLANNTLALTGTQFVGNATALGLMRLFGDLSICRW
jgi:hypothetical protein